MEDPLAGVQWDMGENGGDAHTAHCRGVPPSYLNAARQPGTPNSISCATRVSRGYTSGSRSAA